MILVYIQNREFLTKIVSYLDAAKVSYTTNLEDPYTYVLVADMMHRTKAFMKERSDKQFIFITELEEYRMYQNLIVSTKKSREYQLKMYKFMEMCYKIITSSLYLQQQFLKKNKNVEYIPVALPAIAISRNNRDIYEKYNLPKHRKIIMIVDMVYKHIDALFLLSEKYPEYYFIYVGYETDYNLSARQRNFYQMLGDNISYIKYIDMNIFSDICKISNVVVYFESFLLSREYLYIPLLFKKILLAEDISWYQNFLVNSKNAYLFRNNDTLDLKLSKIMDNRVMNLTERGYELIQNYDCISIIKKYRDCL